MKQARLISIVNFSEKNINLFFGIKNAKRQSRPLLRYI
ncbi:hypothetical protein THEYE_A0745 [Thermodesulfovibrio yellowstonii DSM 11347]|uniref:Uncharacterized protein n=1 Tax=Thermodesulfovibrio yellowstonii (strain ATCC 51303 / DSM 11347 / YP87) TaxID=289376 RepID=B5YK22_THEYD|nr:hypothetical protein THEYE_A0745 [Thermodesulfovibrio yellowstonii DSM 11347]